MIEIDHPRLRGRRLEPVNWHVRGAFSPFWSGSTPRFYALLVCDEGIAAFGWPNAKYWRLQLLLGVRAGAAHLPPGVDGDSWPLCTHEQVIESPRALLFDRTLFGALEVRRGRWLWSQIRIPERGGRPWRFTAADPQKIAEWARRLEQYHPIIKTGWWPKTG